MTTASKISRREELGLRTQPLFGVYCNVINAHSFRTKRSSVPLIPPDLSLTKVAKYCGVSQFWW